jgi:hypothetical protein
MRLEQKINNLDITKSSLAELQSGLDRLEKRIQQSSLEISTEDYCAMLELQALIHYARGDIVKAKSFVKEASSASGDQGVHFLTKVIGGLSSDISVPKTNVEMPEYFTVSSIRFVICNLLTLSIYTTYWSYKNWKAIKIFTKSTRSGSRVHPILNAIFFPLMSYELFRNVAETREKLGLSKTIGSGAKAWGVFLLNSICLGFAPIIFFQKYMNEAKLSASGDTKLHTGINIGEVVFIILGLLYWGFIINGVSSQESTNVMSIEQQEQKSLVDSLTADYSNCSNDLVLRRSSIDTASQFQVDGYNSALESCEQTRQQQNKAVDDYNAIVR